MSICGIQPSRLPYNSCLSLAETGDVDVAGWLRSLGLGQYEEAFRDNDIDVEVLRHLTADDLVSIGVTSVGHRRRLLSAAAALVLGSQGTTGNAVPARPAATRPAGAERRQLTVMF